MNWLWDNIHLKKADRAGMFVFLSILFLIILVKGYLVVLYQPNVDSQHTDVFSSIEYSAVEHPPSKNKFKPYASKFSSKKKTKNRNIAKPKAFQKKEVKQDILFEFDPNTLSADSLMLMGLSKYVAGNIQKYRTKGGFFKESNDLQRIYGMEDKVFNRILPFIKIKKTISHIKTKEKSKTERFNKKPLIALRSVDINLADTIAFKSIKGIGSVYANRIVKFRNSLGGYFTIDQIKEVWGISDSLFFAIEPYLTLDNSAIEKKNINSFEKEVLVKHPYIDWKKAKAILSYKRMHGDYKSMDEFEKLHGLDDGFVDTLKQYFIAQ